jgi:hypothetical protein
VHAPGGPRDILRPQMIGRLAIAVLFVALLVEQSPHLVHHVFEHDEVQADCVYLASTDRQHATSVDGVPMLVRPAAVTLIGLAATAGPITHSPDSAAARAPPSV